MTRRDGFDLFLLAAIWGASFLFMRVAAPAFGPGPLIELRVGVAALVLLPFLVRHRQLSYLRSHLGPLAFIGLSNSALPFVLYAWALLALPAGFAAVANASAPLWAALVAWLWLHDRLERRAVVGLALGFAGVLVLSWRRLGFDDSGSGWAVLACLAATLSYGIAANYTKRHLTGVPPLAVAGASQLFAALMLLPLALIQWPAHMPGAGPWLAVIVLGVACTGLAYFLYFRLIERVGPARAISVTFLVPLFGMLWGVLFGDESVTANMLAGCAIILAGTALTHGLVGRVRHAGGETRGAR
ncbi:MAG: DMT family transporter [Rhodocyclaceae bacterium]|nr:DMT family transporter [Rhodocyclaceae bacterium]